MTDAVLTPPERPQEPATVNPARVAPAMADRETKARSRRQPAQAPQGRGVNWTLVNFFLDAFLLVLFVLLLWATAIVTFVFPAGTHADGWMLWGADFNTWVRLQCGLVCGLGLGVTIHVMLHWSWVCGVINARFGRQGEGKKTKWDDGTRTLVGVGLMIVLLHLVGFALAAAVLMIVPPA